MDFNNTDEVEKFVDWLFDELQSILPAFKQAWPSQPDYEKSKRSWALSLIESDLKSIGQIKNGLKRFRASTNPFVPTAGQFIAMCKPNAEELGIPSLEAAYDEACRISHPSADKNFSRMHKVVYHAWKQTGSHTLSNFPKANSFPVFERNYQATVQMALDGKELEDIPLGISHSLEQVTITKEFGLKHLASLKQMLK